MACKNKSGGWRGDQVNDVDEKPYRVGDGRPPTKTQFKSGISGNPKGRNKNAPRLSGVIEQVLTKKSSFGSVTARADNGNQQQSGRHNCTRLRIRSIAHERI